MKVKLLCVVLAATCILSAHAQEEVSQTVDSSRTHLITLSPVAGSAIEKLEARRGKSFTDEDIAEVLKSPEFLSAYVAELQDHGRDHSETDASSSTSN